MFPFIVVVTIVVIARYVVHRRRHDGPGGVVLLYCSSSEIFPQLLAGSTLRLVTLFLHWTVFLYSSSTNLFAE
ncbi:MAG: hypothetical protein AB2693_31975 [Candidatus Thiodiazotropha sp.]